MNHFLGVKKMDSLRCPFFKEICCEELCVAYEGGCSLCNNLADIPYVLGEVSEKLSGISENLEAINQSLRALSIDMRVK